MTTLMSIDVCCAVCGQTSSILEVCSTNACGSVDLDTRPPEMVRSTLPYGVQRCPACGYCAASLATAAAGIAARIADTAYRETLNRSDYPAKCNEFLCQAMLCQAGGDLAAALWATIHAAWICDDVGNAAAAVACRRATAALAQAAEANGIEWIEPAAASLMVRGDLLRRAGAFQEAMTIIDLALAAHPEPFLGDLLHFEKTLIEMADRAAHTVAEMTEYKVTGWLDKADKTATFDPTVDPARAAMVPLQQSEIAGLPYHQAKAVATRLVHGMQLQLAREADNAYDTEAVAILMDSGEKLGYVPRGSNAGIARRLDAGVTLGIWLTHVFWDREAPRGPKPKRIDIEIRSADSDDAPDKKTNDQASAVHVAMARAATPAMQWVSQSYWPTQFAFAAIEKARAALGRNALSEMLNQVDTAYKWAQEAWLVQHKLTPDTRNGWWSIGPQFNQATRDSGLGEDFALLQQALSRRATAAPTSERDTALALCLLRIESLWQQHLADFAKVPLGGGVSITIGLPPPLPPPFRPPPNMPLARRYTPLRRIEALRPLRRLLRVIQRVECQLPASTAGLHCLRLFNRDRTLVRAILRQLAHVLREQLRSLLTPDATGTCWEPDADYARMFPQLIPNAAKWSLVNQAVNLLEQEPPDLAAQQTLIAPLYLLQPETRHLRHGQRRRRVTDRELFIAEQLLRSAESLDMRDIVLGTCLLMPMDRRNRLYTQPLWQLFDALCAELFGKPRKAMLNDFPSLLAEEVPPLDFAIAAWRRAVADATDAGDPTPAECAARALLLEALVGYPGRWPDDLASRVPDMERLCPL